MALLMKPSVLVTKRIFPEALEYLRQHAEVEDHDSQESCLPDELLKRLNGKDGAVSQLTDKFSAEVIGALPKLRVIANVAVGFDNIDINAATERKSSLPTRPEFLPKPRPTSPSPC